MKNFYRHIFLFILFPLCGLGGFAQTYPVTIYSHLSYPVPIYLSNYANRTTINSPLQVDLSLNDLTIMNRQVRLKFYLQGRMTLVSKDYVIGSQPIYLQGGGITQLTNVQLGPYFEFQNLLGINPNQYGQPIPEGMYDFCVEVYDFATNKRLSGKTCVSTVIFHNDPPFLNLPANNEKIMKQDIQNIVFRWTPRNINVSNVEYEFSLVELWNPNIPYQTAFDYAPPLYTETTNITTLQYDVMKPQLIPGKSYAWRVKAKALKGAEEIGMFKNNGFSEVFTFKYLSQCNAPMNVTTERVSQDQAKIKWTGITANSFDYQVSYREKNARSKWYTITTPREYTTITNLKPNTAYEYTVGTACDKGEYTLSSINEFTTLAHDEIAFAGCNLKPDLADLANKTPLPALFPNDVVTAGDFPIVVQHVSGGNGTFSGDGFVTLPFINKFKEKIGGTIDANSDQNVGIRITFNNIGVNTDFKLISGEIVASYDPNWGSMVDVAPILDPIINKLENLFTNLYDLLKQKEAGTITDETFIKQWKENFVEAQATHDKYNELINQAGLSDELKEKGKNIDALFKDMVSNDFLAAGNAKKENVDKMKAFVDEANAFISEKCKEALKNIVTFLSTEKVNYLKLLASESGKTGPTAVTDKTYSTSIYDEENGTLKITHYKGWSTSSPPQNLFLIETKDAELNKQKITKFWLSYAPNNVDGNAAGVDVVVYFKDPVPNEEEPFCTQKASIVKGISAQAQFADTMGQMVFYGAIGGVSAGTIEAIKTYKCAGAFTLDLGLQALIISVVQKYKNPAKTIKLSDIVDDISFLNATASCVTATVTENCDTKCAAFVGAVTGFGDDIIKQLKGGKSLSEININQSVFAGIEQGVLAAAVQKLITFGTATWAKKYPKKEIVDAFEDLEKNPQKYGIGGVNKYIAKSGIELEEYLSKVKTKPSLEKYEGDFYRTVGNKRDPFLTHYIPKGKSQRYSKPGEDGLFFSSSKEGNFQELKHWDVPIEGNTTTFIYKSIESDNLLDLTNPNVRDKLGIELNQIIGDSYEFTDVIGTWARNNNYKGIIYPSARGTMDNMYFINVILFKSSTANDIVKGKVIEKIIN